MARRTKKAGIQELIAKLRREVPGIVLRTSLIVGFPQETEEEFQELYDFVEEARFDKLGVFTYSKEEGTPAALMTGQVRKDTKEKRRDAIMRRQQEISRSINESKVGRIEDVLIEGRDENGFYGRNAEMAPEIDGNVVVSSSRELVVGTYVKVKITRAEEYDLFGEVYSAE